MNSSAIKFVASSFPKADIDSKVGTEVMPLAIFHKHDL